MDIKLHRKATTTPSIRAEIQAAPDSVTHRELAERFGVSVSTIRRWRFRRETHDRSHTRHNLQATLTPEQETVIIAAREYLRLGLDDLLNLARTYLDPRLSRSGLHRMIKRRGEPRLRDLSSPWADDGATPALRGDTPGLARIAVEPLPRLAGDPTPRYLYLAIDRASLWVHLETRRTSSGEEAARFLQEVIDQAPFTLTGVTTSASETFMDLTMESARVTASDHHPFGRACADAGIEHRTVATPCSRARQASSRRPPRIDEVLSLPAAQGSEELTRLLAPLTHHYNHRVSLRRLDDRSPVAALRQWQADQVSADEGATSVTSNKPQRHRQEPQAGTPRPGAGEAPGRVRRG